MDRQDEIVPEHPNNSNIRCSPQDKRCIQKTLARHPPKSTNQRSNTAREETKAVLVSEMRSGYLIICTENRISICNTCLSQSRCFSLRLYSSKATSVTVRL